MRQIEVYFGHIRFKGRLWAVLTWVTLPLRQPKPIDGAAAYVITWQMELYDFNAA